MPVKRVRVAQCPVNAANMMYHQQRNTVARTAVADHPSAGGGTSTAVHDGFATVRRPHHYVGHKRRRAAAAMGLHLEPVSEHVVGGGEQKQKQQLYASLRPKSYTSAAAALPPLPSDVPWWEIATRRRPKSCADFASVSDNNEKLDEKVKVLPSTHPLPPPTCNILRCIIP